MKERMRKEGQKVIWVEKGTELRKSDGKCDQKPFVWKSQR